MQPKVEDRALMYTRKDANEFDAMDWGGDGGLDVVLEPRWYFPYSAESQFGELWQYWYNKDSRGEEPPAAVKKQMELYDQLKASGDPKKQDELMKEILQDRPGAVLRHRHRAAHQRLRHRQEQLQERAEDHAGLLALPEPGPDEP